MWRLIFSKYKLKPMDRRELQSILDDFTYTCGSKLHDVLPEKYSLVEIRDHSCHDPIEKLYYSAMYEPLCIYCGIEEAFTSSTPVC
jgi:hypothetical protein